jgi:hypothetical protein
VEEFTAEDAATITDGTAQPELVQLKP